MSIKPRAWICEPKVQRHPARHLIRGVSAVEPTAEVREFGEIDGDQFVPLYDQAAIDAAVAAERERIRTLAIKRVAYEQDAAKHHAGRWQAAFEFHATRNAAMCELIDVLFSCDDDAEARAALPGLEMMP
jgi:hypothetical protein